MTRQKFYIFLFFTLLFANGYSQNLMPVDEGSAIKFTIKNFGFSTYGSFSGIKGKIQFDEANIGTTSFMVSVDAASINTDNGTRDKHLLKEDYFYVEKYPVINFASVSVKKDEKTGFFLMTGNLTIKGITKQISFPFTEIAQKNGFLFSGTFNINRRDFGVGGSSMVMSDNLQVSLSVFCKANKSP